MPLFNFQGQLLPVLFVCLFFVTIFTCGVQKSVAAVIHFFYTPRNESRLLISSLYILETPGIKVYASFNKFGQTITTRANSKLSYWVYGYYVPMRTVLKEVFLLFMFRTKVMPLLKECLLVSFGIYFNREINDKLNTK